MANAINKENLQEVKSDKLTAKCIKYFYDKENDCYVEVGKEIEVSNERLQTLIAHGVAVKE